MIRLAHGLYAPAASAAAMLGVVCVHLHRVSPLVVLDRGVSITYICVMIRKKSIKKCAACTAHETFAAFFVWFFGAYRYQALLAHLNLKLFAQTNSTSIMSSSLMLVNVYRPGFEPRMTFFNSMRSSAV